MSSSESTFRGILKLAAICTIVLLVGIFLTLLFNSLASIRSFGLKFIFSQTWDPVAGRFGAVPFLVGTLITSFLALIFSLPFSLATAIFLGEYFRSGAISSSLKNAIELLAGIPSVIYGFWSLFVLVPLIRSLQINLNVAPFGVGIFTASVVLSIMIVPYSASISREVISLVPADLKEAAFSLGATRFEVIRKVILPYARSGILAGILLALGRALGETMAVTMVIGNANSVPRGLFSPANTMASVIANEFTEATESTYLASLVEIGLLLLVVTTVFNIIGKYIIRRQTIEV